MHIRRHTCFSVCTLVCVVLCVCACVHVRACVCSSVCFVYAVRTVYDMPCCVQSYALIRPHACPSVKLIHVMRCCESTSRKWTNAITLCHCTYASVLHRSVLDGSPPDNVRETGLKLNESNCQPGARIQGLIIARHTLLHSGLSCPLHSALPVCSS